MTKSSELQSLNNILVVDDTPANLHLLADVLKKRNYNVRPVPNGKLALAAVSVSPPDLILLDIMMPDLDGYEVCKQLKAKELTKNIPVIFLSAIDEPMDKVKAFAVGGADYITKPFQIHELLIRIKNQLSLSSLQKKLKDKNEKLNQTIERLKQTQKQVIQIERLKSLDKLVSGLIHEINHPLWSIDASLNEINYFIDCSLEEFPDFFKNLSPEQNQYFFALLQQCQQPSTDFSIAKKQLMTEKLSHLGFENAETIAQKFIELGCGDNIESFLPLLTDGNYLTILDNVSNFKTLKKSTQVISKASEQISRIFSALKDYSRYDLDSKKRQAHISNTIDGVLYAYRDRLTPAITIKREYCAVPAIFCYPEELQRVWKSLIDNALFAMGNSGTLTINLRQEQNSILVKFMDTGTGIPKEIVSQICEPFFTTKPPGEGSGLGLSIAKQIIEKHDGSIAVKSTPSKTQFTITLPIVLNEEPQLQPRL